MNQGRNILGLALLTVLIAGLSGGAAAVSFQQPAQNVTNVSGSYTFKLTNATGNMDASGVRFNISRNSTQFVGNASSPDDFFFNTTEQDTTGWTEGLYYINATVWNYTTSSILEFTTTWIKVDNTAPSINITYPPVDGNFTNTSEVIKTNISDELSPFTANYVIKNGTSIERQGSLTAEGNKYTASSIDLSGLADGRYTLVTNATDDANNSANTSQTIHIDYNPPSISFNSDANFINVTITDTAWSVNASTAVFTLENSAGTLLNGTGSTASSNTSLVDQNNSFYTYDLNTSDFTAGNYTLHIWANDTNDNRGNNVHTTFYIDETAPNVTDLMINDTSNASSFYKITNETIFSLNATYSDSIGVSSCSYNVYNESEWANGATTRSGSMNLSVVASSTANVSGIDLTGLQGNYTFQVSCTDYAGNTASNTTIEMTGGTTVSWFPVDDAGPYVVNGSITPANGSYVATTDPAIGLDMKDFSTIDNSSVTAWFDGSAENVTLSGSNETTLQVRVNHSTLQDGNEYSVVINGSDARGAYMGNISYNFTVDTTAPTWNDFNITTSGTVANDETWYSGGIDIDAECTDTTAGIANYTVEADNSDNGDGETVTGSGQQTLTFSPAEDTVDSSVTLTVTCTDQAGNTNSTTLDDIAIDTAPPVINQKEPTEATFASGSTTDVAVTVEITDDGSGFIHDGDGGQTDWDSNNLDPYFGSEEATGYGPDFSDGSVTISWTQNSVSEGSYEIALGGEGNTLTVQDAAGNQLDIDPWTVDVTKNEQLQNLTNPDLEVGSPADISLIPGQSKTVSITVDNTGDAQADVTVTTDTDNDALTVSADPEDFNLDAGNAQQVDVTVQAGDQFSGSPSVSVTFSYSGNSDSVSFNVNANEGSPTLNVASAPNEVSITAGNYSVISLSVENSGTADVNGLTPELSQFTLSSSSPSSLNIPTGQTRSIDLNISVSGNHSIGVFPTTITLSNDDHSVDREISLKVQPSSNATRQNISRSLNTLRDTVNNLQNDTLKQQLTQQINDAQTAIVANDYAQAADIIETVQQQVQSADTTAQPQNEQQQGGLPLIPLFIAIIFLVAAGGLLAYVFLIGPEDETGGAGDVTFSETSNRVEEIGKRFLDTTGDLIAKVERSFSNLLGSAEEEETGDEEDVEIDRKKIRFDEV